MKESVKQFCSLNRLDSVTVEQIYTAYLRAENDEIRVKANTDDPGGKVQVAISPSASGGV